MHEPLLQHIARQVALSEAEKEAVRTHFEPLRVRRKEFLLQAGDRCRYEHFVLKGCLRAYAIDQEGKEHIIQFAVEDWWIGDMGSFLRGTPAAYFIEAVETSELLVIDRPGLEQLFEAAPGFERFYRLLVQNAFVALQQRILGKLSQTAEERYRQFVEQYPTIEQRVPQTQVAAYLGMTPEFLSRVRRQKGPR